VKNAFRERAFELHLEQPDKGQQNVDVAPPPEKFLRTPMSVGFMEVSFLQRYT